MTRIKLKNPWMNLLAAVLCLPTVTATTASLAAPVNEKVLAVAEPHSKNVAQPKKKKKRDLHSNPPPKKATGKRIARTMKIQQRAWSELELVPKTTARVYRREFGNEIPTSPVRDKHGKRITT